MKLGQLIEYIKKSIFFFKTYAENKADVLF